MKKFFLGIGIFLVIIITVGFVAIKLYVNEDLIKENLVQQAKQLTQQNVAIEGDLNLTFYPQIGFELGGVTLFNQADYADAKQVEIKKIHAAVELMSLFSKTIVVNNVHVEGISVNVETLRDGRNNMESLIATLAPKDKPLSNEDIQAIELTPEGDIAKSDYQFVVGGVSITDANFSFNNRKDGTYHQLSDTSLTIGKFEFTKPVDISLVANYRSNEIMAVLKSDMQLTVDAEFSDIRLTQLNNTLTLAGDSLPRPEMTITLAGDLVYSSADKTAQVTDMMLTVDELELSGNLSADLFTKPRLSYELAMGNVVLDDWLPKATEATKSDTTNSDASKPAAKKGAKQAPEQEPDLSVLSAFEQKGSLTIAQIKQGEYVLDNFKLQSQLEKGVLQLTNLTADLYEGKLTAKGELNSVAKPAVFSINSRLDKVQSEQLVTIAAGKKLLTGLVDVDVQLSGQGLTVTRLKSATAGNINTVFSDGAILGVNVAQKAREAIAKVTGKQSGKEDLSKQTDFSSMIASFKLGSGKLTSTEISLHSPAIKMDGTGQANLILEQLDFNFGAYITEDIGGQSSSTMKTIRKLRFPVDVKGPWAKPEITFDTASLAKQILKSKEDKLKKSLDKKLDKKLDKYLGSDPEKQKIKDELFKGLDKWFN
ncbi:MAG: AsmA protein [Oleiphilaceae bacterium]|jgi:AsmA protein